MRVSPFNELKDEDKLWVQQLLEHRIEIIKKYIIENRGHKIPRDAAKEQLALSGDVFMGNKNVELGLVDSLNTFRGIFNKEYDECRIIDIKNSNELDFIEKNYLSLKNQGIRQTDLINLIDELPSNLISNRLSLGFFN
jgi:ClpP class serine protease